MKLLRLVALFALVFSLACNNADQADSAETTAQDTPPSETGSSFVINTEETDLHFHIVSNSAGPIRGMFPKGVSGSLDQDGKGSLSIDINTLYSLDQNDLENPLRDSNVVEAFFGTRPHPFFAEKVDAAWALIGDQLQRGLNTATFEVTSATGLGNLADGASETGQITGSLKIWNKIEVPLAFDVAMARTGNRVEVTTETGPTFNLETVLGADLRKLAFDTMLAAGCAHQPGIQNDVTINLTKVIFEIK